MKIKGVNIFERHGEKAFLALVTLIFAVVVVWQFALGGNTVRVAGQQSAPIDQAYEQLARVAEGKLGQMQQEEPDPRIPERVPDALARLDDALAYRGPDGALPVPLGLPIAGVSEGGFTPGEDAPSIVVRAIDPPTPENARAGAHAATIDPLVVARTPELEPFVPAAQPHDLRAVSVAANFDAGSLLESLREDPDGDGPMRAVPEPWWRGRIEILDVQVERRRVHADGQRSGATLVPPLPGRFSLRDRLGAGLEPGAMPEIVSLARQQATDIVQPRFYNIIAGEPWAPPEGERREDDDSNLAVTRLLRQLDRIRREIEQARTRLSNLEAAARPGARDIFDPAAGVLAQSVGGGGGGRGGDSGSSTEQLQRDRQQSRRESLQARLSDLEGKEAELVAQLVDLGVDPDSGRVAQSSVELNLPVRIPDADELTVWGHDLAIEPGAEYEYRIRVAINNPLFGIERNLAEESRDVASEPVLYSDWSAWTPSVAIERDFYWFVTRANPGGRQVVGVAPASARVEVYRFYYGYWRQGEAPVRVGDPVAAAIDVADLNLPRFEIQTSEQALAQVVNVQTPERITGPLTAAADALLLDVRTEAVQSGRSSVLGVVVRAEGGDLIIRRPAEDIASELRQRLQESVGAGLLASVGVPGQGLSVAPTRSQEDRSTGEGGGLSQPGGGGGTIRR